MPDCCTMLRAALKIIGPERDGLRLIMLGEYPFELVEVLAAGT